MSKLFLDIVGQKNAIRILRAQIESEKLSHAYIFLGDEGVGKGYLAKKFAQYLLCPDTSEDNCPSCRNFDKGVHPDFISINGKEGIKIEQIREVIERINLSPSVGKRKVLYISRAENLGIEAANALLKTLEEPPLDSIIILTAISEKSLPQTIISRGQKIKLNSLTPEDIKNILNKEFSEKEIAKVLTYCEGSIGEAKSLLNDSEKLKTKISEYDDIEIFLNSQSLIEKFKIIDKHDKQKNLKAFFYLFSNTIFDILACLLCGKESKIVTITSKYDIYTLTKIAVKTLKIYENLEYNVNLKIAMEEIALENALDA